jgi:hypothetical protein
MSALTIAQIVGTVAGVADPPAAPTDDRPAGGPAAHPF